MQDSVSLGALRLEARLAAEASRLTQSGDTVLETRLAYVKPSLQVSGPAPGGGVVRLKLFRDVAQLNFEDFVSFASFAEERVVGGNPDLRPQIQWRLEGGYNRPFGTRGAVDIVVYRTWARDVADFVPLLGRFDAPGNIGPGRFWGAALKLTAPLDAVVPGGLVNLKVQLDESRVTDPTTGRTRRASGLATHYSKLEFRQDLPRWRAAWGVSVEDVGAVTFYRRAEIERTDQTRRLDAFVEHAVTPGLKVRLYGANITNWLATRQRTFFAGGRTGPATSFERRERNPGRWFGVEMRGTF